MADGPKCAAPHPAVLDEARRRTAQRRAPGPQLCVFSHASSGNGFSRDTGIQMGHVGLSSDRDWSRSHQRLSAVRSRLPAGSRGQRGV